MCVSRVCVCGGGEGDIISEHWDAHYLWRAIISNVGAITINAGKFIIKAIQVVLLTIY